MKRSILYTAVFSAMLMVTGCGGSDDGNDTNPNNSSGSNNMSNNNQDIDGNQNTGNNTNPNNSSGSNNMGNNNQDIDGNQNTGNNNQDGNQQIEGETWIVKGRVLDTDNHVVENAKVSVLLENIEYSTKSDKNGEYTLKLPQDFKYPEHLSGIVHAEGYKPTTLLLSYQNKMLYIDEESNNPIIKKMQEQDVIFFNGLTVIHLGDDFATGSANSQFQVKSQGLKWKDSFTYSAAKKAKYDEICISLLGKGIQSSTSKDKISLSKNGHAGTAITQTLKDSAKSGEYTQIKHCFSLQSFNADDQIDLLIESNDSGNGYDDFEMINIEGMFRNSGSSFSNNSGSGSDSNSNTGNDSGSNTSNNGGSGSIGGSGNSDLCTTYATAEGKLQCVGKDNINYLFGGFNSFAGNFATYMDNNTYNTQTATSCSVTRSGNTLTINISSLGVSSSITAEALQVFTPTVQDGQVLYFLTSSSENLGTITNVSSGGGVVAPIASLISGGKTYSCAKY